MSDRSEKRKEKKKIKKEKREARKNAYSKQDKQHIALVAVMAVVALVLLVKTSGAFWSDDPTGADAYTTTQSLSTSVPSVSTLSTEPSTVPSQSQTTTEKLDVSSTEPQKEPVTENKKEEPKKDEKEEILKKVVDGVNSLKASDASYIGKKNQYIDIQLTDCSVPAVTGLINNVLKLFMGEEKFEYDFTNGVAEDPEEGGEITTNEAIPPSFVSFGLTSAGVKDAYTQKDGENTVYTIEIIPEESSLDSVPPHHSVACDVITIEDLNIPAKITKADYRYSGTKISVTYNAEGKVVRYHEYFDTYGVGEGGAMGITATCVMEGYIDETWDIEWK